MKTMTKDLIKKIPVFCGRLIKVWKHNTMLNVKADYNNLLLRGTRRVQRSVEFLSS